MKSAKKRVLIIDDEVAAARLLKLNLHHTGRYTAETVNKPTEALAVAREFLPDIILLDVMMPEMDGGEVAAQLRTVPALKDIPIVFLTAATTKAEVASKSGFVGGFPFVAKPIRVAEVVKCLEKVCANPGK